MPPCTSPEVCCAELETLQTHTRCRVHTRPAGRSCTISSDNIAFVTSLLLYRQGHVSPAPSCESLSHELCTMLLYHTDVRSLDQTVMEDFLHCQLKCPAASFL